MNGSVRKKVLPVSLLVVLVAFVVVAACVCLGGCGEIRYDHYVLTIAENGDGTLTVTACTVVKDQPVVIPSEYDGKKIKALGDGKSTVFGGCEFSTLKIESGVEEIADNACLNWTPLTTLEIGDGLKKIGANAFAGCVNLKDIDKVVPVSVESIGEGAFTDTAWYKGQPNGQIINVGSFLYEFKGNMPDNYEIKVTDFIAGTKYIADYAFSDCIGLKAVALPDSLEKIGAYAFAGCTSLVTVSIPKNINTVGEHAFDGCTKLGSAGKIVVPNNIGSISASMFYDCSGLTEVEVESGITKVNASAFENCVGLQTITLPETVSEIGENAFANCVLLETVTAPKVKKIEKGAFYNDIALHSYQLSDDIEVIGDEAFYNCVKIETIEFPVTLKTVGENAFNNCVALEKAVVGYRKNDDGLVFGAGAFGNCFALSTVECQGLADWCAISFSDVTANPVWNAGELYVDEQKVTEPVLTADVKSVSAYAFVNTDITKITVSKNLLSIGESAFKGCIKLKEGGVVAEDVRAWCGVAFADPEANPLYYGETLYVGTAAVTKLDLSSDVEKISAYAFYNDVALEEVLIGKEVSYIGAEAFSGCSKLAFNKITVDRGEEPETWDEDWDDFIGAEVKDGGTAPNYVGKSEFKPTTNEIMAMVVGGILIVAAIVLLIVWLTKKIKKKKAGVKAETAAQGEVPAETTTETPVEEPSAAEKGADDPTDDISDDPTATEIPDVPGDTNEPA